MYAVVVILKIEPEAMPGFLPLIKKNAAASRLHEPGCRRYDVCTDDDSPDEVWLYQLYDNREAYEEHLATWHFQTFDAETAHVIHERTVRPFRRVSQ